MSMSQVQPTSRTPALERAVDALVSSAGGDATAGGVPSRLLALGAVSPAARARAERLIALAVRGLPAMCTSLGVAHTMRRIPSPTGQSVLKEGDSLRYAAMTALGAARLAEMDQSAALGGWCAATLARRAAARAERSEDIGAVALAAWAAAEVNRTFAASLFERLARRLVGPEPLETVACAWTLTAAVAARDLGDTGWIEAAAADRLMDSRGAAGLFPHLTPWSANLGVRANVGCFADQVYPLQALARFGAARGDAAALAAASACAARICDLQGPDGQWWWHYDLRGGGVVEGYPVYSVHQHAMAPMALLDLWEAGGVGHWRPLIRGLEWLDRRPEVAEPLISESDGVIWRKVARREPKKVSRALSAATAAIRPGLRLPGLNAIFPPNRIDHECRPYEFGWLLYAWLSSRGAGGSADVKRGI